MERLASEGDFKKEGILEHSPKLNTSALFFDSIADNRKADKLRPYTL